MEEDALIRVGVRSLVTAATPDVDEVTLERPMAS